MFSGLMYLTDGFKGGETIFPHLNVSIAPRAGRLVFFRNTLPPTAGAPSAPDAR